MRLTIARSLHAASRRCLPKVFSLLHYCLIGLGIAGILAGSALAGTILSSEEGQVNVCVPGAQITNSKYKMIHRARQKKILYHSLLAKGSMPSNWCWDAPAQLLKTCCLRGLCWNDSCSAIHGDSVFPYCKRETTTGARKRERGTC